MIRIGIDYSLNSPSICIDNNGQIRFMSLFNTEGAEWNREKPLKKFFMHNALSSFVSMLPYQRTAKDKKWTYAQEQSAKMNDAKMISDMIAHLLEPYFSETLKISLEGFAFASNGASFIDLILFNSFLRKEIIDRLGTDCLEIVAPTSAKKLAGKGNADKEFMIKAFMNNVLNDDSLSETELWKYLQNTELDFKNIKPLDDIVDSYFIMKAQTI